MKKIFFIILIGINFSCFSVGGSENSDSVLDIDSEIESIVTKTPEPSSERNKEINLDVVFKDKVNLYLNLDVPKGFVLKELVVKKYEGDDKIAFFAIQKSSTYTAGDDISKMVAWGHFGPESGNVLFYSDNLEFKNKVPVKLSSGSYSIRFAQNNYKEAKYKLVGKLISASKSGLPDYGEAYSDHGY